MFRVTSYESTKHPAGIAEERYPNARINHVDLHPSNDKYFQYTAIISWAEYLLFEEWGSIPALSLTFVLNPKREGSRKRRDAAQISRYIAKSSVNRRLLHLNQSEKPKTLDSNPTTFYTVLIIHIHVAGASGARGRGRPPETTSVLSRIPLERFWL